MSECARVYRLVGKRTRVAIWSAVTNRIDGQRGALFPWMPVFLACGIGWYFKLTWEPGLAHNAAILAFAGLAFGLAVVARSAVSVPLVGVSMICIGVVLASTRAHSVAAPVLGFRYYGPIEGRVVGMDRSLSDKVRITLDRVALSDVSPGRSPTRVRVAIHTKGPETTPATGATVILSGHLSPPQGPVEPGGFDFQRRAWFQGLGAVGYTRSPVLVLDPPVPGTVQLWITKLRHKISASVRSAIPGNPGGFAAAVLTGDRSGMDRAIMDDLRASNLAHLLAISGLHMGLLTGFVFAFVRIGLALIPPIALRLPIKKIAAIAALAAGAFYLALSGGAIATERAFIMVAMMFGAVLLDRRALTLRAVALAAIVVLTLRPESLVSPGFQMSFAATTALVSVFRALRGWSLPRRHPALSFVIGLIVSSAVAGAATAPISAAHFNQLAQYGLLANFLSVPLMGTVVIPAAVIAALLSPVGLEWIGLWFMQQGVTWILGVSRFVAGLDGSLTHVPSPSPIVLPLISIGVLVVILWRGRERLAGLGVIAVGLVLWTQVERPAIMISSTGGMVGILTDQGRVLSKPRGEGFVALSWLENDGDPVAQRTAADRKGFHGPGGVREGDFDALNLAHLTGKSAAPALLGVCAKGGIVVTSITADATSEPCQIFDAKRLSKTGAIAFYPDDKGHRIVTARDVSGTRLWNAQ